MTSELFQVSCTGQGSLLGTAWYSSLELTDILKWKDNIIRQSALSNMTLPSKMSEKISSGSD